MRKTQGVRILTQSHEANCLLLRTLRQQFDFQPKQFRTVQNCPGLYSFYYIIKWDFSWNFEVPITQQKGPDQNTFKASLLLLNRRHSLGHKKSQEVAKIHRFACFDGFVHSSSPHPQKRMKYRGKKLVSLLSSRPRPPWSVHCHRNLASDSSSHYHKIKVVDYGDTFILSPDNSLSHTDFCKGWQENTMSNSTLALTKRRDSFLPTWEIMMDKVSKVGVITPPKYPQLPASRPLVSAPNTEHIRLQTATEAAQNRVLFRDRKENGGRCWTLPYVSLPFNPS